MRAAGALAALIVVVGIAAGIVALSAGHKHAGAAPGDVQITSLSCDTSPEYVRIKNFGSSSQSLTNFAILSDPSQNYSLSTHVGSIGAGQTLEFQSGTG